MLITFFCISCYLVGFALGVYLMAYHAQKVGASLIILYVVICAITFSLSGYFIGQDAAYNKTFAGPTIECDKRGEAVQCFIVKGK